MPKILTGVCKKGVRFFPLETAGFVILFLLIIIVKHYFIGFDFLSQMSFQLTTEVYVSIICKVFLSVNYIIHGNTHHIRLMYAIL